MTGSAGLGVFLLFSALLAVMTAQQIIITDLRLSFSWLIRHLAPAIASLLLVSAVLLILLGLSNRYWLAFSLTLFLCYVFAMVDHIKYETALTRFLWSDLFKTSDPGKFKEMIGHYIRPSVFIPIFLLLTAGNLLLLLIEPAPFVRGTAGGLPRLAAGLGGLLLFAGFRFYAVWVNWPVCRHIFWLPAFTSTSCTANVEEHGTLLAFMGHITTVAKEQDVPYDYSATGADPVRRTLEKVLETNLAAKDESYSPASAECCGLARADNRPTIIVLAVEALWDITRVPGLTFTHDPLESLRADYAGEALASCFAGLTSNTEFEFLTSLSMQCLHDSACPFIKIDHPVEALPAHLRELGYATNAMHSYSRTFYSRDTVYAHLGFDQFLGLEEFEKAGLDVKKGWYMGDEALVQPIVNLLEQQSGPQLIYTLTVQNHGPYTPSRYAASEIEPASRPAVAPELVLSAGELGAIVDYTQGVRDAGKMYRAVRDYCERLDRPVIVLTFGDHLPGIGENHGFSVFKRAGMIESTKDEALFSIPVFCWANEAARPRVCLPISGSVSGPIRGLVRVLVRVLVLMMRVL